MYRLFKEETGLEKLEIILIHCNFISKSKLTTA